MMCKYAIPHMISAGRGFIVNNASILGLKGFAGLSVLRGFPKERWCSLQEAWLLSTRIKDLE